tara:strand:- start:153 stop:857 length:705 start_codon:yes stop_codon:yes gene_type:complete
MIEESTFETFLSISPTRFEIYLLDKKKFKNIYEKEIKIVNKSNLIDLNLLSQFLDDNIFKIEKLLGQFLKNINLIIDNDQILYLSFGIKKKNYEDKINKKFLENTLIELKDLFKENYQSNKIIHFIVKKYLVDDINHYSFNSEVSGKNLCLEVNVISISHNFINEINNVLEKYQIKIEKIFDKNYLKGSFKEENDKISIKALKIKKGLNLNEIVIVPKSPKKIGFFDKFFQLFS